MPKMKQNPTAEDAATAERQAAILRRYLDAAETREELIRQAVYSLRKLWEKLNPDGGFDVPPYYDIRRLVTLFGPGEVEVALRVAQANFNPEEATGPESFIRYTRAILRNRRRERGNRQ
jgi:hypothetical protein